MSEIPKIVIASHTTTQVAVEYISESEPADWKADLQQRLIEMDVDPEHDTNIASPKGAGI